jgi:hypothetical protein
MLRTIGLINHLGKACFIQGLYNERIQTIVRSRGESILLSQAIEISLEEESAILSAKERSPSAAMGPSLRCNKCNKLGHARNKCLSSERFPTANAKAILSCFGCGREGHIARDYRRRPTDKGSVGRDTEKMFKSVSRDTRYRGNVGTDTDISSGAQGKGWIRSGNDGRESSSNPTTARRNK